MIISIPHAIAITEMKESDLKRGWRQFKNMPYTQVLGNNWIREARTAVLKIPSAIISGESNYLLNPAHGDYSKVKLIKTGRFEFDARIKENN